MIGDSLTSKRWSVPSGAGRVRTVEARSDRAAGAGGHGLVVEGVGAEGVGTDVGGLPPPSEVGGVPETGSQTSANAAGGSNIAPASTSSASEPFIPVPLDDMARPILEDR